MATQIITRLLDDLDGSEAAETVRFAYDGVEYTIDLSAKNAAKLRKALGPYQEKGVRVTPARPRRLSSRAEDTAAGRALIRTWARRHGGFSALGDRGRIPADVVAAYRAANG